MPIKFEKTGNNIKETYKATQYRMLNQYESMMTGK